MAAQGAANELIDFGLSA